MTRPELNSSIDTVFDDTRPDYSLAPSMEGAELKKVADYADQELLKKVDKVTGERLINAPEIVKLANQSGTNTGDQDLSVFYTKTQVDGKVTSIYRFRGNVANFAALPSTGLTIGDVYNLTDTGANWAWTGTIWDNLGTTLDVSGKEDVSNKSTDGTLASNSDAKYPSEKAVKTYVDAHLGSGGGSVDIGYKVYTAILEFVDGSTITSNVLQNTIGDGSKDGINDIQWSYNSAAQPKAFMLNIPFTYLKTICVSSIYMQGNEAYALQGGRINSQQVRFYSSNIRTGIASLAYVPMVYVEIRVYN